MCWSNGYNSWSWKEGKIDSEGVRVWHLKGIMNIFSSVQEFNTLVSNLPNRLKKQRGKRKLGDFRYDLGNNKSLNKFLNRINW